MGLTSPGIDQSVQLVQYTINPARTSAAISSEIPRFFNALIVIELLTRFAFGLNADLVDVRQQR